jgi:hypothetical protein
MKRQTIRSLILEAMHDMGMEDLQSDEPGTSLEASGFDAYPNPMTDETETTGADTESYEERTARLKRQAKESGTEFDMEQDGGLRAMKKMIKSNAGYRVRQFLDLGQSEDRIRFAAKVALDEIFAERKD